MSRFYDEFYRQKGTRHDDLVIRCATDDALVSEIIKMDIPPKMYGFKVESCDGSAWFPPGAGISQLRSPKWDSRNRSCRNTGCSDHPSNGGECLWIKDGKDLVDIYGELYRPINEPSYTYETEVVCRNGNFIVGYADMVFDVSWSLQNAVHITIGEKDYGEHPLESEWIKWFTSCSDECDVYSSIRGHRCNDGKLSDVIKATAHPLVKSILVEVKPDLSDIGSIIRQLKTYKDLLRHSGNNFKDIEKSIVVTYSSVGPNVIKLLDNEGITCITVSEEGRV